MDYQIDKKAGLNDNTTNIINIWQLPTTALLSVCGVLQDLQDLINTAATCTAAVIFIKANWDCLKPSMAIFLKALTEFGAATLDSSQGVELQQLKETGDIVAVPDPESMTNKSVHLITACRRFKIPRDHGSIVSKLVLSAVNKKDFFLKLEIGGSTIFDLTSEISSHYVKDGVFDLM
jgi:hypothetical protein